jgi:hypothetical protein
MAGKKFNEEIEMSLRVSKTPAREYGNSILGEYFHIRLRWHWRRWWQLASKPDHNDANDTKPERFSLKE